jgi:hypothetical protein
MTATTTKKKRRRNEWLGQMMILYFNNRNSCFVVFFLFSLSLVLSLFSNFFSRMCTRLNKYDSERTYEMILDEAARRRRDDVFSFSLQTKPQVRMWRRNWIKAKNFSAYFTYTYNDLSSVTNVNVIIVLSIIIFNYFLSILIHHMSIDELHSYFSMIYLYQYEK